MSGIEQNDLQKLFQNLYKRNTEESKRLAGVNEKPTVNKKLLRSKQQLLSQILNG